MVDRFGADRVLYAVSSPPGQFILGNPNLSVPVIEHPVYGEPYFYDRTVTEPAHGDTPPMQERIRVAALYLKFADEGVHGGTMLVQVGRSRANREQLARRILVDTALPLSALVVLMTVIVWAGIRAGLAPLPGADAELRASLEKEPLPVLAERLLSLDPAIAARRIVDGPFADARQAMATLVTTPNLTDEQVNQYAGGGQQPQQQRPPQTSGQRPPQRQAVPPARPVPGPASCSR